MDESKKVLGVNLILGTHTFPLSLAIFSQLNVAACMKMWANSWQSKNKPNTHTHKTMLVALEQRGRFESVYVEVKAFKID